RIRSIALVHEFLSRAPGDQVDFREILRPLLRMVEEGLIAPDHDVHFEVEGDAGELPADVATPLAVALTELLQNAVEHGFPEDQGPSEPGRVVVSLRNDGEELVVRVHDNGVGLPEDFSLDDSESLGLTIVRALVTTELAGKMTMDNDGGTLVELR